MHTYSFIPFPEHNTDRLVLRRIMQEDAPEIFFLRSDKKVLEFLNKEPATSIEEVKLFMESCDKILIANDGVMWGIALKEIPKKIIGTICYWQLQPENYRAEIGYVLHPNYWRQGIMKEAIEKVLEYGAAEMKLHRVEARLNAENLPSAAILEATGFKKEGHLKEDFFYKERFYDTFIYSIILPASKNSLA